MKFIAIESVRGLEIDEPVFVKDAEGNYGYGRLIEEKKTAKGIERSFELAKFSPLEEEDFKFIKLVTNITHVCIPK